MSYIVGTLTPSTTGIKTIPCGFLPVAMRITVSGKTTATTNNTQLSIGAVDNSGYQVCDTIFQDTTGGRSTPHTDRMVSILERVSGTITEVGRANFDSFTATSAKFNVTVANTNYQYRIEVWG